MRKSKKRISPVAQAVAVFGRILAISFLALLVLLILAPVVWMFLSAFRPPDQIVEYPPRFFPKNYVVQNFKDVYKMIPVNKYILNSFIFSGTVTLGSTLLNSMAGYAFARMQFKGKNVLFMMFMASMMIPFQVIMIPLFMIVFYMGMLDTYRGLIIPQLAGVGGIFFLRSFFITLPAQLEEAGHLAAFDHEQQRQEDAGERDYVFCGAEHGELRPCVCGGRDIRISAACAVHIWAEVFCKQYCFLRH